MKLIKKQLARNRNSSLTDEELNKLICEAKSGCNMAMNTIITKNMGLVMTLIGRQINPKYQEDCFQEGCMAIKKAVKKFDSNKGFKFSTYASFWIDAAAKRWLSNNNGTVRIPEVMQKQLKYEYTEINPNIANEIEESHLDELMDCLSDREKRVINSHLCGKTFYDVSKEENISKSRVHQIYHVAINKMKLNKEVNIGMAIR